MTNQYSYAEDFASKIPEVSHKKTATPNISSAAKVYMMSRMQKENAVNGYRSGNDNGQKYMTSEDFVTYFRSRESISDKNLQRTARAAEMNTAKAVVASRNANAAGSAGITNSKPGEIIRSSTGTMPTRENVARNKAPRSNISAAVKINNSEVSNSSQVKRGGFETKVFSKIDPNKIERIKNIANDWLPEEEIISAKPAKKDRSFKKIVLGIAGVAISLMLIVSGSVMLNDASREVKALENEVNELKKEEAVLRLELDMKNDINVLRDRATADLGMIGKEYVEANYLDMSGNDEIKVFNDDSSNDEIGFSTILSAFGIN